ncbi:NAD-dependent epimerase/dehydratase family protein [Butyrivibrio sp. YAB3001]|uniref:NAD-dependent epimerase/dehydratase family protein n=1 Tax=Butyrivibrio sp. YAB3001 TaxID=1520812 RepID=UPI0008F66901|nr:NAD(P)-dependent oxidoreductase [Butyrivibrio sp. YAB3001]SFC22803.1 Nucleoside-diphosphate-sugar epimerase [Butyrivibrio sp. YAB3001]
MNTLYNDIESICSASGIDWERIKGKTILISGSTGLIGSNLVKALLIMNRKLSLNATVIAMVRSKEKAEKVFADFMADTALKLCLIPDGVENCRDVEGNVDYIIHGANPTSSKFFVNNPVETIETAIGGTRAMLEIARKKNVSGFIFLSTMEIYGYPKRGEKVKEDAVGGFNTEVVRNCYPLSKQLCENLCFSFCKEYGVPARVARLTQTFGPGVEYNDGRVFAEFARCAIEKRNITLKTKGETERCYLYTLDAVTAILTILLMGESGNAYTVANEDTYCSIYEMAKMVADEYGIDVVIEEQDVASQGYANTLFMDLDTSKLRSLGWNARVGLKEMYAKMIEGMNC